MNKTPLSDDLLTFHQRQTRYSNYIENLSSKRFTTGLGEIDDEIRGVAPGEVMTIIAYSGTFKSAYLQNILWDGARRTNHMSVMFSMEMPVEKVFEREIQIATGETGWSVENKYKRPDGRTAEMAGEAWKAGGSKILVCDRPRLTIKQIRDYICLAQSKYDEIGAVGIDYLGLMKGEGKSIFERMAELSAEIKDLAKSIHVPVIVLGQVNRGYATSQNKEIEMDAAKGGGDIEAGADFMLGLFHCGDDLFIKILKNRNGKKNLYYKVNLQPECFRFVSVQGCKAPKKGKEDAPF